MPVREDACLRLMGFQLHVFVPFKNIKNQVKTFQYLICYHGMILIAKKCEK
jgi:hypothetical protein